MRVPLGVKILLPCLAVGFGLAGATYWVVSAHLTRIEEDRARAEIDRKVAGYLSRTKQLNRDVEGVVRLLMEDPNNRAFLDQLEAGGDGVASASENLALVLRSSVRETAERRGDPVPAFQMLMTRTGPPEVVVGDTDGASDAKYRNAVQAGGADLPRAAVLSGKGNLASRYVWIEGKLYVALGVPLRTDLSDPASPPTHAYFAGYVVDTPWVSRLVLAEPDGIAAAASGPVLHAWIAVNGVVVARGGEAKSDAAPAVGASATAPASVDSLTGTTPPAPIEFDLRDEHFIGEQLAFAPGSGAGGVVLVASSLTEALKPLRRLQRTLALIVLAAACAAVVAFRFVSEQVARPVRALVAATRRIAIGNFGEPVDLRRKDELGELAESLNSMSSGLRQRDLIKEVFGKFVDPRIGQQFLSETSLLRAGGERREQSILFSDLANFTRISEQLGPEQLVSLLNRYFGHAADAVTETGGVVDKFIGDAVVAFWGPPLVDEEYALRACCCGLSLIDATARLAPVCKDLGIPPLGVRVGIATGDVLVGLIGSANRYDYTVIGDTANLGSRLEGLNKLYRTSVLVCHETARQAGAGVIFRQVDTVRVVGRAEPVTLFQALAVAGDPAASAAEELRDGYAGALKAYQSRDWPAASRLFTALHEAHADLVSQVMADRCDGFIFDPPAPDWDGVWHANSK